MPALSFCLCFLECTVFSKRYHACEASCLPSRYYITASASLHVRVSTHTEGGVAELARQNEHNNEWQQHVRGNMRQCLCCRSVCPQSHITANERGFFLSPCWAHMCGAALGKQREKKHKTTARFCFVISKDHFCFHPPVSCLGNKS